MKTLHGIFFSLSLLPLTSPRPSSGAEPSNGFFQIKWPMNEDKKGGETSKVFSSDSESGWDVAAAVVCLASQPLYVALTRLVGKSLSEDLFTFP